MTSKITSTTTTVKDQGSMDDKNKDNEKYKKLIEWFQAKNVKVLIALSGGVDSAVVGSYCKKCVR